VYPEFTIERLRAYKGLEHISDIAARQVIEAMGFFQCLASVFIKESQRLKKQYIDNQ